MKPEEILHHLKTDLYKKDWEIWYLFCIENEEDKWLRMQTILLYKRELREKDERYKREKINKHRFEEFRVI
jgi:hypothetical protein